MGMSKTISLGGAKSGCFGLSVDSTPDQSHINQLIVIVRYDGFPIELFLTFLEMGSHKESMANMMNNNLTNECKIVFISVEVAAHNIDAAERQKQNPIINKMEEFEFMVMSYFVDYLLGEFKD
ncbi:hypothetical protein CEXT_273071 [Caerostris extrusa]|uniref:Uncharacterized protein n=1 Tax=Caerostris extrusa TaxID=172846 RepID=A0AAV4P5A3_CAEEX|nr:hypothetical protein CEXT_273071 [Caerostris extrusa]